jgi:predicted permease
MILQLFSIVAPVLITAGVGFWWVRSGRGFDVELITALVTLIGAPCLVFNTELHRG